MCITLYRDHTFLLIYYMYRYLKFIVTYSRHNSVSTEYRTHRCKICVEFFGKTKKNHFGTFCLL